jgi:molecular chaperone DnaK
MKQEAEANADADKAARERVDKLNAADSLIFQTEKSLKDYGDKIPAEKKQPIEDALTRLKDAHKAQDVDACEKLMGELNTAFSAASEEMYKATQEAQANGGGASNTKSTADADVTDVDFEEVKDTK